MESMTYPQALVRNSYSDVYLARGKENLGDKDPRAHFLKPGRVAKLATPQNIFAYG